VKRKLYIIVAMLAITAVAVILIAPCVNLQPSALRASRAAVALLLSIGIVALSGIIWKLPSMRLVFIPFVLHDRGKESRALKLRILHCRCIC
jgi:uncharacterized membrane protein